MVILEGATTSYDPYDSIHEMLNGLELQTQKTRKMVDEPWEAIFRRVSSIEEPRASSISTQRDNVQRVSPSQNHFMQNKETEMPNALRLQPQKTRKIVGEPWETIFRRVSSIEEPRANSVPKQRVNVQRLFPAQNHFIRNRKSGKKGHKSDSDVQDICRKLAESRETCYKGSMREVQFRLMDLDRHHQQSGRNSRNSL